MTRPAFRCNCNVCEALKRRHLPVGLCGSCTHPGGVQLGGHKLVLVARPENLPFLQPRP